MNRDAGATRRQGLQGVIKCLEELRSQWTMTQISISISASGNVAWMFALCVPIRRAFLLVGVAFELSKTLPSHTWGDLLQVTR